MIFGSVSSPCSAQFVKNRNAQDFKDDFPEAVAAVVYQHYMDDYFDSTDSIDEAVTKIKSVIKIHQKGVYKICNWTSCSPDVLKEIPSELRGIDDKDLNGSKNLPTERVLGMSWNPTEDTFFFGTKFHKVDKSLLDGTAIPTKRGILTVVMSIYDPIGFLHPLTIKGKILLQDIWREGIAFDVPLSSTYTSKWRLWLKEVELTLIAFQSCATGSEIYT
ncbi:unnamed protein product [Allacma fusca]|uniref:Uncharacterized protein n=1 Tax=Allacma fusca TaxID=39272 RepID=A0A8J2L2A0_9HEXA|nr:unnamed protein product [Allacma fusca]